MKALRRRHTTATALVLGAVSLVLAGLPAAGCGRSKGDATIPRVIILGLDGLDHDLTSRMMKDGRLPGLSRLAKMGSFSALGSAVPAQSPVAWSDFITGADAGVHGIFDFIQRDAPAIMYGIPRASSRRTRRETASSSTLTGRRAPGRARRSG